MIFFTRLTVLHNLHSLYAILGFLIQNYVFILYYNHCLILSNKVSGYMSGTGGGGGGGFLNNKEKWSRSIK